MEDLVLVAFERAGLQVLLRVVARGLHDEPVFLAEHLLEEKRVVGVEVGFRHDQVRSKGSGKIRSGPRHPERSER